MNDSIVADPQFSVSLPGNSAKAVCFEVHGTSRKYFNLISDSCTSINAHFTSMPDPTMGNRMSNIGIHTVLREEPVVLGEGVGFAAESDCVDIRFDLQGCAASVGGQALKVMGSIGDVRYRKYTSRNYWRVSMPNCGRERVVVYITCQKDMLRLDVGRGSHLNATSHGLLGEYFNSQVYVSLHNYCNVNYSLIA